MEVCLNLRRIGMTRGAHTVKRGQRRSHAAPSAFSMLTNKAVGAAQAMSESMAQTMNADLVSSVIADLNSSAPTTRRAIREAARQQTRKKQFLAAGAFTLLAATTGTIFANAQTQSGASLAGETTGVISTLPGAGSGASSSASGASRSSDRTALTESTSDSSSGAWSLTSDAQTMDVSKVSKSAADNPKVADLMDRDSGSIPANFNPNHATGDSGLAYEFSQCTWWVYLRRHQLGLPVGSYFGNAMQWANSARALGYWVDHTPRVGDIVVFQPGQEHADSQYGHVAVVESIVDGKIVTSESNAGKGGVTYSRTIANPERFEYIHY